MKNDMKKNIYFMVIMLLSLNLLLGCSPDTEAEESETAENIKVVEFGDQVIIDYIAKLEDGTIVDRSSDYDIPVIFVVGNKQVLPGIEKAVIGMRLAEEKEVIFPPLDAYGYYDENRVRAIPKNQFPEGPELKVGKSITLELANGNQVKVFVIEITEDNIVLDFNHNLAGQTLTYLIKILNIQKMS